MNQKPQRIAKRPDTHEEAHLSHSLYLMVVVVVLGAMFLAVKIESSNTPSDAQYDTSNVRTP